MSQGYWVRGWFGVLVVGAVTLFPVRSQAGFEIGNGTFMDRVINGTQSVFEALESLYAEESEQYAELWAPASDGGTPRTRMIVNVVPIQNLTEETIRKFLAQNKGWIGFSVDEFLGVRREREVRKDWNRLEAHYYRQRLNEKFVVQLEGNRKKSPAYEKMYEALISRPAR